jgi:hypothetical protein
MAYLLPVSCSRWQFTTGINVTSGTSGKFAADVVDISGAHGLVNISANIRKKFKMTLIYYCIFRGLGEDDS